MATFDARKNFAKVTVSTGYAAGALTIVLASGHGAKLPQPSTDNEFNLVWWNNSDYGDPSDDPNREIVRCTARTTDTLTVTRAQESTSDSLKNIATKTYRMALTITEKVIDDIIDSLGASSTISVNQTTHGFAVGEVLRSSGTDNEYAKALADSSANAEALGMVTTVTDANNFIITTSGLIDVAAAVPTATAGDVLFLDPSTAGAVTATEPTLAGQVSKPIGIVTADDTEMVYVNFRGLVVSDTDFPSQTYITVKMGTEADGADNKTFSLTTGSFTAGKYLSVYKNGQLQEEGASADYQTSGTTIAVFNSVVLDTDKITLVVRSYTVEGIEDPFTTAGDVMYRNATEPARVGIGTTGQLFTVNSGATAPEWTDPVSGSTFGGDGSDGALNVTTGTTNIDASNASSIAKNYSSINVSVGAILGLSNPGTTGSVLVLRSSGDVTIAGDINLAGDGAVGVTNGLDIIDISVDNFGGNGGTSSVAATGGVGGTGAVVLGSVSSYSVPDQAGMYKRQIFMACGSGGGWGGNSEGTSGRGAGGRGGGCLIIECAGTLTFTGSVTVDGGTGSNGTYTNYSGSGGGGGGAAGMAALLYVTLGTNTGTVYARGGAGGNGASGGPMGNDRGAGGGGGGAGGMSAGGENGGRGGNGGIGVAGTATTDSSGAGGGGGGTEGSYAGGAGGAQGASDTSNYFIAKNIWF